MRLARIFAVCSLLAAAFSCAGQEGVDLTIRLRTDFQPLREFLFVEVIVDAQSEQKVADVNAQYVRPGQPVATFLALPPARKRPVAIKLKRLGGSLLVSSTVIVEHQKDLVLTVSVTRDCSNVVCGPVNGLAQRCLAGVCLDARCATGNEPYCSESFEPCTRGSCTTTSPCAIAVCQDDVCFEDVAGSACATDEVCDLQNGCVPHGQCPGGDGECTKDDASAGCMTGICVGEVSMCLYTLAPNGAPPEGSLCDVNMSTCMAGSCVTTSCSNAVQDGTETDIDCGGDSCGRCPAQSMCAINGDCASGLECLSGRCQTALCANGIQDGAETDIDCGGGTCMPCAAQRTCQMTSDCVSGLECAVSNTCELPVDMCLNGVRDGDESDVDCGGSCAVKCVAGQMCASALDCEAGLGCDGTNHCVMPPAHCTNSVLDGDESDVDCGGSCVTCGFLAKCNDNSDCATGACDRAQSLRCENPDICGNGVVDAGESCDDGQIVSGDMCASNCLVENWGICGVHSECDSGFCGGDGLCHPATCNDGIKNGLELNIDCGGGECAYCGCSSDIECGIEVCDRRGSLACEPANSCGNGRLDAGEACDDGNIQGGDMCSSTCLLEELGVCGVGTDCQSGYCGSDNLCRPAHCNDSMLSGDESASDCGGSCDTRCGAGAVCNNDGDCIGYVCTGSVCEADHCGNGMMDGDEVGADCGGSCSKTCVSYDCMAQTQLKVAECEKLKDYYNAADGSNWTNHSDWFSDAMPCGWSGISCVGVLPASVAWLNVDETAQRGVIARGLDALPELELLSLGAQCCLKTAPIRGTIPPELGNLSKLQTLVIEDSLLSGEIPSQLSTMPNLLELRISRTQTSGSIPSQLSQLPALERLIIRDTNITGSIPSELSMIGTLVEIDLYNNALTGEVPPTFSQLSNVTNISLSRNHLVGAVPASLGQASALLVLNVSSNELIGPIPPELGQLSSLTELTLNSNNLWGSIPAELGDLSNLVTLRLNINQLSARCRLLWACQQMQSDIISTSII